MKHFTYGDNTRGSGGYRKTLATVYTRRLMEQIKAKERGHSMRLSFRLKWKTGRDRCKTGYAVIGSGT